METAAEFSETAVEFSKSAANFFGFAAEFFGFAVPFGGFPTFPGNSVAAFPEKAYLSISATTTVSVKTSILRLVLPRIALRPRPCAMRRMERQVAKWSST